MSLPTRQQQALDQIEARLQSGDARLKAMFATFTRLTAREAMPATEAICRKVPRLMVLGALVLAMAGMVMAAALVPGPGCIRTHPRSGIDRSVAMVTCRTGPPTGTSGISGR